MDLVYFNSLDKGVLVLGIRLTISAEGVFGLLSFFIFDYDSGLMKCSKIRIMAKIIYFLKWDNEPLIISSICSSSEG